MILVALTGEGYAQNYSVGVYYYPGWRSDYLNWKDIKGLPDSKSPNKPWPDREPLLGYYPEEEPWVAEKHIEWAYQYGINFFAYDWYWDGKRPEYDHALKNYLKARNKNKIQFCLLWANHDVTPKSLKEFDDIVAYWIGNYFAYPTYYKIDGKPVVFIFSVGQLETKAKEFGTSVKALLEGASSRSKEQGHNGIFFVATTNERPGADVAQRLHDYGFNAYTGWNYVQGEGFNTDLYEKDAYDSMVDAYLTYYMAAFKTSKILPYIVPASPGWDSRPWHGDQATVRKNPTPDKFAKMLLGAKQLMDGDKDVPKILMIESWNEFGEGSYIEPTKKWQFAYLQMIKKIFSPPTTIKTIR